MRSDSIRTHGALLPNVILVYYCLDLFATFNKFIYKEMGKYSVIYMKNGKITTFCKLLKINKLQKYL